MRRIAGVGYAGGLPRIVLTDMSTRQTTPPYIMGGESVVPVVVSHFAVSPEDRERAIGAGRPKRGAPK